MKKCLKCEKKIPHSFLTTLKLADIRTGKVKCPNCKEFNFVTKESIVDFNSVATMPFFVGFILLFANITLGGFLIGLLSALLIAKYMKGWFVDISDVSPFANNKTPLNK